MPVICLINVCYMSVKVHLMSTKCLLNVCHMSTTATLLYVHGLSIIMSGIRPLYAHDMSIVCPPHANHMSIGYPTASLPSTIYHLLPSTTTTATTTTTANSFSLLKLSLLLYGPAFFIVVGITRSKVIFCLRHFYPFLKGAF